MTDRVRPTLLTAAVLALAGALTPAGARAGAADALRAVEAVARRPTGPVGVALAAGHDLDPGVRETLAAYRMLPEGAAPALENLGYSCASAALGLALGNRQRLVLFVGAGLARIAFDSWAAAARIRPASPTGAAFFRALAREGGSVLVPTIRLGITLRF